MSYIKNNKKEKKQLKVFKDKIFNVLNKIILLHHKL
jgi:hypothetical protein